mgnify:FL=1
MKKGVRISLIIFFLFILILSLIRLISPREIDDVSPEIPCEKNYLEKSKYLWVIPNFQGNKISENPEWCKEILSLNKTLGMHGIKHTYREFKIENISQEELEEGIKIFEECFGFKPEIFKPPYLRMNKENRALIKENNLKLKSKFNQDIHKVYHCNNSGTFNNRIVDVI